MQTNEMVSDVDLHVVAASALVVGGCFSSSVCVLCFSLLEFDILTFE